MALAPPPAFSLPFHEKRVDETPPASPTDAHAKVPNTFEEISVAEEVVLTMGIPDMLIQMAKAFQQLEHKTGFANAGQLFEAAEGLMKNPEEQARVEEKLLEAEQQAKKEEREQSRDVLSGGKVLGKEACAPGGEASAGDSAGVQTLPAEAKPAGDTKAQQKERLRKLARENHRLRQRKVCRKCKEVDLATSGVTFLPCGHFITCETCSDTYEECPACGKSIMGTVRTYLC